MTTYTVPCNTLFRLSQICKFFQPHVSEEKKSLINTIRLENKAGYLYAIATNSEVAAIERIGPTDQPDDSCHLKIDPDFTENMRTQAQYGVSAVVTTIPMGAFSMLQTPVGLTIADCCYWFGSETPMHEWRTWADLKPPSKSSGSIYLDLHHIEILFSASPSGKIVFQEFIDVEKPITIRDRFVDNWVGLFIPCPDFHEGSVAKAKLPDWWK
jgi:hypothetical protein